MDKSWISKDRDSLEYEIGVENFLSFAEENTEDSRKIPCPCGRCGNFKKFFVKTIMGHLYENGFSLGYTEWIWHGKKCIETRSSAVCEAAYGTGDYDEEAHEFKRFMADAEQPLFEGSDCTKLESMLKLHNWKSRFGISYVAFTELLSYVGSFLPTGHVLPVNAYEAKNNLSDLGLDYIKFHVCLNDCILYRGIYSESSKCPNCNLSRSKFGKDGRVRTNIPAKVVWYFPIIPRFKRLFKSTSTAEMITWHLDHRIQDGLMRQPADSPFWRNVDHRWPSFGSDSRNLRIALSTDDYWKFHHVRHCLNVMHTEKNVCDNLIGTLLNIRYKSKECEASLCDMMEMGVRDNLAPQEGEKKTYLPPASYTLSKVEKKKVLSSFLHMKLPFGHASNIKNCVSMPDLKMYGLKSHDCHILLQQLLPVAIRSVLPKNVRISIIRLCFFFNSLCNKVVDVSKLDKLQSDRFNKVLKSYVRNRYFPEGCMAESYIKEELVEFFSEFVGQSGTTGLPKKKSKLSGKPSYFILTYEGYVADGVRYFTKERDDSRVVQNSGVSLVAKTVQVSSAKDLNLVESNMTFYGIILDIWELDYHEFKAPLFLCKWAENERGIKVDDIGFTLVDFSRQGYKKDKYVSIDQVKQVFYVEDPVDARCAMKTFNAQTGRGNIVPKIKNLVGSPKQLGGHECGYVVMRYMKDWANKSLKSYKIKELDVVRIEALGHIQDKI
ncbi:uncharacterized protein LOC141690463 [Apium graveolens]|uniref:uncharacterized protein LOC141690463 n=1 Tax=Apium graveolens TaxID=4045 RepID=UPI003D7AC944